MQWSAKGVRALGRYNRPQSKKEEKRKKKKKLSTFQLSATFRHTISRCLVIKRQ
jgi:hypothetical protein